MRRDTDDDLLAAYVDGVTELSPAERRSIEARLADDPALRAEADATRGLLSELRDLPKDGSPDFTALEREIATAVGPGAPRNWRGWRWVIPGFALAGAAAIAFALLHDPPKPATIATIEPPKPVVHEPVPSAPAEDEVPLYLDGEAVQVDVGALEALDELSGEDELDEGLLSTSDLGWIDELDDAALDRAETWLSKKKS